MTDLVPVYTRIALRYLAPSLVALGVLSPETAEAIALDPDVAVILGAVIAALTEAWYAYARRNGGAT
jgi:preprotein translocase subunit Sec61beta